MVFVAFMILAMLLTLGVVAVGIVAMAKGGSFNARWGNKLMRARILLQLIALVFFALAMFSLKG